MIGLVLAALAVVGCPLAFLAYALLRGVIVRVSVDVRPASDDPPRAPRARTLTQAAPAARPRRTAEPYATPHPEPDAAHPHALGVWGDRKEID